jgi:hypothetical protein
LPNKVPLNELAVAVENAVQQALAKHGAVSIDKLWVGFVAPDAVATQENAALVARELSKEAGVTGQPSVAQISGGAAQQGQRDAHAGTLPGHIIGLVFQPKTTPK